MQAFNHKKETKKLITYCVIPMIGSSTLSRAQLYKKKSRWVFVP